MIRKCDGLAVARVDRKSFVETNDAPSRRGGINPFVAALSVAPTHQDCTVAERGDADAHVTLWVECPGEAEERVIATLWEAGTSGVEVTAPGDLTAYFAGAPPDDRAQA